MRRKMRSLEAIQKNLEVFESKFGMKCIGTEQGSGTWLNTKLGVISASNASRAMAKVGSKIRDTYLCELIGQIASGYQEEISSKYLEYGAQHEGAARANFELLTDSKIIKIAFVFKDETFRCGCSPDGLLDKRESGLELKVPFNVTNYIRFFLHGLIDPDYMYQVQFSMWVTDAESWEFAMYAPLMKVKPLKTITIKRDPEVMDAFNERIPLFIKDMDVALKKLGLEFGVQWARLKL